MSTTRIFTCDIKLNEINCNFVEGNLYDLTLF